MVQDKPKDAIQKRSAPLPAKAAKRMTVGALEAALLSEFPAEDAEDWDRTGLYVGEAAVPVQKVAVALDPTVTAIAQASSAGAQVLITHHPAYLSAPATFAPEPSAALSPGAAVFAAVRNGVALMDFHTALDVSKRGNDALPALLGLKATGKVAHPIAPDARKGYGQICRPDAKGLTVQQLAARCTSVFGRAPRVWGADDMALATVVVMPGSASGIGADVLASSAQCLVCGELKYHEALDLSQAGLAIVELGHDLSELPLVAVLADAIAKAGVPRDAIMLIDQSENWHYPEAIRL